MKVGRIEQLTTNQKMTLGVSCWRCRKLINRGEVDEDAPRFAHKVCPAGPVLNPPKPKDTMTDGFLDVVIRQHDTGIRRHEIGKMKALMQKYTQEAVQYLRDSTRNA